MLSCLEKYNATVIWLQDMRGIFLQNNLHFLGSNMDKGAFDKCWELWHNLPAALEKSWWPVDNIFLWVGCQLQLLLCFTWLEYLVMYLIMCLFRGTGRQRTCVCIRCRQVCWQIPHLHRTVLTARNYERRFHSRHGHTHGRKIVTVTHVHTDSNLSFFSPPTSTK